MTKEKGVIFYIVLIVMAIGLLIALELNLILAAQVKISMKMKNSMMAFYAADTGIEKALCNESAGLCSKTNPTQNYSGSLDGIAYNVAVSCSDQHPNCPFGSSDDECYAYFFCYKSTADYNGIKRAIEIER